MTFQDVESGSCDKVDFRVKADISFSDAFVGDSWEFGIGFGRVNGELELEVD